MPLENDSDIIEDTLKAKPHFIIRFGIGAISVIILLLTVVAWIIKTDVTREFQLTLSPPVQKVDILEDQSFVVTTRLLDNGTNVTEGQQLFKAVVLAPEDNSKTNTTALLKETIITSPDKGLFYLSQENNNAFVLNMPTSLKATSTNFRTIRDMPPGVNLSVQNPDDSYSELKIIQSNFQEGNFIVEFSIDRPLTSDEIEEGVLKLSTHVRQSLLTSIIEQL